MLVNEAKNYLKLDPRLGLLSSLFYEQVEMKQKKCVRKIMWSCNVVVQIKLPDQHPQENLEVCFFMASY